MLNYEEINGEYASNFIKPRNPDTHKGNCGRILIIAGTVGMAGASVLCSRAGLKSGAGLVTCAIPDELFNIVQVSVPEATCINRAKLFGVEQASYLSKFDAIAFGPGMGVNEENYNLLKIILQKTAAPVVIDADGINTICEYDSNFSLIKKYGNRIVLTPHPGEANRMLVCAHEEPYSIAIRLNVVRRLADFTNATVLLKGSGTLVTEPNDLISYNMSGNPGMATGGSGDVLTGVITALLGGGFKPCSAARLGAFIHGLAGDIACENRGEWGMTAVDILEYLPAAFMQIAGR